jgi:hypothetical protein
VRRVEVPEVYYGRVDRAIPAILSDNPGVVWRKIGVDVVNHKCMYSMTAPKSSGAAERVEAAMKQVVKRAQGGAGV